MLIKNGKRIAFQSQFAGMPLITGAGTDILHKPISLAPHVHTGYELTYLTSGEVVWETVSGEELRLTGGTAAIIQPGESHCGRGHVITPGTLYWIVFDPKVKNAAKNSVFSRRELIDMDSFFGGCGNVTVDCTPLLETLKTFRLLLDYLAQDKSSIRIAQLRAILCLIISESYNLFKAAPTCKASEMELVTRKYIEKNLSSPIAVKDLADQFGYSISVFSEQFRRECGMTPGDFISRIKCQAGAAMLRKPRLSITDIAFNLGFSSSQYFASVFKKYHGTTPSQWRKNQP